MAIYQPNGVLYSVGGLTMWISRIQLRSNNQEDRDFWRHASQYNRAFQLVRQFFPNNGRSYLYRVVEGHTMPVIFAVSEDLPQIPGGTWRVDTKEYAPQLWESQHLAFTLLINPTVRKVGGDGKSRRYDVLYEAKKQMRQSNLVESWAAILQREGARWLAVRAAHWGFEARPEAIRVESYQKVKLTLKGKSPIKLAVVNFAGVLTVAD